MKEISPNHVCAHVNLPSANPGLAIDRELERTDRYGLHRGYLCQYAVATLLGSRFGTLVESFGDSVTPPQIHAIFGENSSATRCERRD